MNASPVRFALTFAVFQTLLTGSGEVWANDMVLADTHQQITRAGARASVIGSPENFTGHVRVEPAWSADENSNVSGGLVSFEPGARSAWHTHPVGQRLVVISGAGLTQEWGKPVQQIRSGDVIWCPPGVKHWHGAASNSPMTHLAVTGTAKGKNVSWMEKITDEQYDAR